MEIPVRQLICCSGDLADLKYKSCDIEAWSPRQKSILKSEAVQTLPTLRQGVWGIRYKNSATGKNEFAHTLNNTVVAPPRMLIAFS